MTFKQASRLAGLLLFGLFAAPVAGFGADAPCPRDDLVLENWLGHLHRHNPDIDYTEVSGVQRTRLLRYFGCDTPSDVCPPDKVLVCACEHRETTLVVFVKADCVRKVTEMPRSDLERILKGAPPRAGLPPRHAAMSETDAGRP